MSKTALRHTLFDGIQKMPAVGVGVGFCAAEMAKDRPFVTPVELWAKNPRLLRALAIAGVSEDALSGDAADFEKLTAWVESLPRTVGATLFADLAEDLALLGVSEPLRNANVQSLWHATCDALAGADLTPTALLSKNYASLVSVDATETLSGFPVKNAVYPLVLFDALFEVESPDFAARMRAFSKETGEDIADLIAFETAVGKVLDRAVTLGARAVSVDVSCLSHFERPNPYHAGQALLHSLSRRGEALTAKEIAVWHAELLRLLGLAARARGLSLILRVRPKTERVLGDFSVYALEKLLSYLEGRGALVKTALSLAAGDLPRGLAGLLGRFRREDGTPMLYFGIEGAGASRAALRRSLHFYFERGALPVLLGITDSDVGHFGAPTRTRFAHVLADLLARFAATDGAGFAGEELLSVARACFFEQAASFFNL